MDLFIMKRRRCSRLAKTPPSRPIDESWSSPLRRSARCSNGTISTFTACWPPRSSRPVLDGRERNDRLHPGAAGLRGGLHRAPVRRAGVRPDRRHGRPQEHIPRHDAHHGPVDLRGRLLPGYEDRRASPRRSCWSCCACSRVWRWAANMAARRPMSPSMRPTTSAGFYTSWIQITATIGLFDGAADRDHGRSPGTGVGEEEFKAWGWRVPFLSRSCCSWPLDVDTPAAARKPGLPEDEGRRQDVEEAR
jgi:hypothetical protein